MQTTNQAFKATLDNFSVIKTLGSGISAKVKLARRHEDNKEVALKIFKLDNPINDAQALKTLKQEVEIYSKLKHPFMVELIDFKENATYTKLDGTSKQVAYMVLEFCDNGELFDYVALKAFSEPHCRFYFRQMLQVLHSVHSKGFAHRDLKPENIMIDKNFNVKLADFGFAAPLEGRKKTGFLHTHLGTQNYMAPEILLNEPYQGHTVDLFALGIILFILYSGHPPFKTAHPADPHYKLLA